MTGLFSLLLVLLAGACLLPSLVHLRLWWNSRQDLSQLWFALLGAGAATYILCTVRLYASPDVESYREVLRVQTWATPVVLISLLGVSRGMSGAVRLGWVEKLLIPLLGLVPVVRLLDRWTFMYQDVTGLGTRRLWNGEMISVLQAESNPIGSSLVSIFFLSCIVLLVHRGFLAWKRGRTSVAAVLLLACVILLGSAILDTIIVVRVLPLPFLSEPALAGMVLLFGWKMQGDLFRAGALRQEMEAGRAILAALVEHGRDLVTRLDPAGVVTYASPSIQLFVGLPAVGAVGQAWANFAVEFHRAVLDACFERLRRGSSEERISYAIRTGEGRRRWVETIACAHRDEEGNLVEFHCVTRDIDEAMRREERLQALEGELREMNATLERRVQRRTEELSRTITDLEAFASTASHDLRAPLRAMSGYAHALDEDHGASIPPEGRQWLERIRHSATRLGTLIESLLQLARTGQRVVSREPTDLGMIATEVLESLSKADPGRTCQTIVGTDLIADCDPAMARGILENLIGNAWKYSSKCERTVIEVGRDGEGWFFVRDEGAGFDMKWVGQIFQSFQRLHGAEEFEGDGIGLASVRRMIDLHGGDIQASSEKGRGATFRFQFGNSEPIA